LGTPLRSYVGSLATSGACSIQIGMKDAVAFLR